MGADSDETDEVGIFMNKNYPQVAADIETSISVILALERMVLE